MTKREFYKDEYTTTGKEWFEPDSSELKETMQETRVIFRDKKCTVCYTNIAPQLVRVNFERSRTWCHTHGISGEFSGWGEWGVVSYQHLKSYECRRNLENSEIPF